MHPAEVVFAKPLMRFTVCPGKPIPDVPTRAPHVGIADGGRVGLWRPPLKQQHRTSFVQPLQPM
jgi:hypothetical protein